MWSRFVLYIWPFFLLHVSCILCLFIYVFIYLLIYLGWLFIYLSIHSLTCHTAVPLVASTPMNGKDVQAQSPNLSLGDGYDVRLVCHLCSYKRDWKTNMLKDTRGYLLSFFLLLLSSLYPAPNLMNFLINIFIPYTFCVVVCLSIVIFSVCLNKCLSLLTYQLF